MKYPEQQHIEDTLDNMKNFMISNPLLIPFLHLVDVDLAIVGGSIRDMVLDKEIKDLDMYVRFNFYKNLKIDYSHIKYDYGNRDGYSIEFEEQMAKASALNGRELQIASIFLDNPLFINLLPKYEEAQIRYYKKSVPASLILSWVVEEMITQSVDYNIVKNFNTINMAENNKAELINPEPKSIKEDAYEIMGLFSVVGISDNKCRYGIELLFTIDDVKHFIDKFDFDICKIYMNEKKQIIQTNDFEQDKKNKTITYNPAVLDEKNIHKSLGERYPRLEKKYPDYELTMNFKSYFSDDEKRLGSKLFNYYHLEKTLLTNYTPVSKNKL